MKTLKLKENRYRFGVPWNKAGHNTHDLGLSEHISLILEGLHQEPASKEQRFSEDDAGKKVFSIVVYRIVSDCSHIYTLMAEKCTRFFPYAQGFFTKCD